MITLHQASTLSTTCRISNLLGKQPKIIEVFVDGKCRPVLEWQIPIEGEGQMLSLKDDLKKLGASVTYVDSSREPYYYCQVRFGS